MTAHKHFKQLVRARMQKTGESYTTARRHLLRQADVQPEGPARWHLPGNIPATTALRILLSAAGVRHPGGGLLSEQLLFGIAGGIGIGVAAFRYEKEDFSSFYIAGRHIWQDDVAYLRAALGRFGIKPVVKETAGAKAAEKQMREALADGSPCIAWVDMVHLPHRALPQQFSGGGYHLVTVHANYDDRKSALIGDLNDAPVEIPLADLATARGRIKSFKNRLLSIPLSDSPADLAPMVRAGLAACHAGLTGKPVKGPASMSTFEALRRWAERLHGSTDRESWERMFPRGHLLWQGLTSIHDFIENYHTGGGLCRPLFAECLAEASDLPELHGLRAVGERYSELGATWSDLAAAVLPEGVPAFREARELYARRSELLSEGNPDNASQIREVWSRLAELKREMRECFPLSETQCTALLASLQQKVSALHDAERAAHAALGEALP